MFTLFFAGNAFAQRQNRGVPVQEYLQSHYFQAVQQVVARLKGMSHVLGYDSFNEPSPGWIGWQDVTRHQALAKMGDTLLPGRPCSWGGNTSRSETWKIGLRGIRRTGRRKIDPQGQRAWLPGHNCLWRANGVWDYDSTATPVLNNPEYFAQVDGWPVDFNRDFLTPFLREYTRRVRSVDPMP